MSVILAQGGGSVFYKARGCWVSDRASALNLETVERAIAAGRVEAFSGMQIIAQFDQPACELVFPLRFNGSPQAKRPPAAGPG